MQRLRKTNLKGGCSAHQNNTNQIQNYMKKCSSLRSFILSASLLFALSDLALAADQKATIPVIVKDTTSFYWQIVLAGARQAGQDLNVNVPELGAQSESDINGQISILENAVSEEPAAIVIADSI
jgi:ribose transport system substrate-binding protein